MESRIRPKNEFRIHLLKIHFHFVLTAFTRIHGHAKTQTADRADPTDRADHADRAYFVGEFRLLQLARH